MKVNVCLARVKIACLLFMFPPLTVLLINYYISYIVSYIINFALFCISLSTIEAVWK